MANQYLPPLHRLRWLNSIKPLVNYKPEDPRSNLEEFIKKFYPDSLNDTLHTDLQSQLKESTLPNGDTDFSKISLDNLRFLNLKFAILPKFDYSTNSSETLNYSINYSTFKQNIQNQIAIKNREFQEEQKLKEQAKQTLTDELQKLSLDDIQKKLEDVKKIETTDDLFGAIIPQGQTQDSQPSTDLKFNSKRAKDQISEFLIAEEKLAGLSENTEIQIFYFEQLQEIKEQKLKNESKKILTTKLQNLTLYAIEQTLTSLKEIDTDDLSVASIPQGQTQDSQPSTDLKFNSKRAKDQISEFLIAEEKLAGLSENTEIQQFYFKELEIIQQQKQQELKEQAKQVLTDELQKLSLDDIKNKLEDFKNKSEDVKKNKTTDDDDFEEFKFDSTKAKTQISTILTARQNLTKFADDKEIQQFYFYELQEIEFEKEKESKKLQTQQTQLSTNSIQPQSLKKSSSLFSIFSWLSSSSSKEKSIPVEDRIKSTTKRTRSLPNIPSKAQPSKRSVKKTTSIQPTNSYSEQHPSSNLKKNQEFRNFFKPTFVDKIKSARLWLFESIKNFDFSSPSQGPEIIGPAMKAYKKFGVNPDEAKNFASFLSKKFTANKHTNKSLTFDDFIKKQNVDSLLNEFEETKSQSEYQEFGSPPAISITRRARSLTTTNSDNTGQAQASRSRLFLTPSKSNPSDDLIEELLKEPKFIVGQEQKVYGNITETRTTFFDRSFNKLTPNQQKIVRIFDEFKRSMGKDNWNNTQHLYPPYKISNNKSDPDQHITTALKSLNSVLSNHVESSQSNREKDLDFAGALYNRISETPGFDHRKDYGNNGLHGKIQQILNRSNSYPTRPPSRFR